MARVAWKIALLVGALAIAGYFLLPGTGAKDAGYALIGFASVAMVTVGIKWHRPADRRSWWAIAAGSLCFVLGDTVYDVYQFGLHRPAPFPSVADVFYLAGYPFLIVGVVGLTRRASRQRSRESYADAAIITFGALAFSWHFLMASYAQDTTIGVAGRLVTFAYPVMDLAVVFMVARGLVVGHTRNAVLKLLFVAVLSMIVADFIYDLLSLHGVYAVGDPVDAGWLINYILIAAAALHPANAAKAPTPSAEHDNSGARLPLVAAAGFVAPVILLIAGVLGSSDDVVALAAISVILGVLIVLRLWWMVGRMAAQNRSLAEALSERAALETELRHLAFHDSLTGLPNRALLHDRLEHALAKSHRTKETVALLVCDLDGFKIVNDGLGHLLGDAVLVAVGTRLAAVVRPGDTVARLGGDEFAVLLEDIRGPAEASAVATRIVSVLREPMTVRDRRTGVSVSVGVALATGAITTERLLSQADSAMHEAKKTGKDRISVFEPAMHVGLTDRLELSAGLDEAIEEHQLFLDYQPQFALDGGKLVGFEALVRWAHPVLGLVGPDRFIPVAEDTGRIVAIGRLVLAKACEQAAEWNRRGASSLTMSVNVSGRQLQSARLVDDLRVAVARSGIRASQLVLEITESVLIADTRHSAQILAELKGLGVRLAIDDFGTGYSSLSYLRRMPVDELKIDKSFVDSLCDPAGDGVTFVSTIVRLARSLGLRTVAEGIEDDEQREVLAGLGCDCGQGFLLGRPLDGGAATRLVDAWLAGGKPAAGPLRLAPAVVGR